jgi:HD-GYP domain-containing protein (c-di-GMP phosphodiesterase class II)
MSHPAPGQIEAVDVYALRPGDVLECDVFSRHGAKLLSAGVTLSAELYETLLGLRKQRLYYARSVDELYHAGVVEDEDPVRAGEVAQRALVTRGGVIALEEGDRAEEHHVDAYDLGAFAGLDPRETRRDRAKRLRMAEQLIAERSHKWERLEHRVEASAFPMHLELGGVPGWPDERTLAELRAERVDAFRPVFARIVAGVRVELRPLSEMVEELVSRLERHPDRFTQLALLTPRRADYLPDHCYTTAVLSVAIAAHLGWSREDIRIAGLAGLLSDVGMALVPREVRGADRPLDEMEVNRVFRHPTASVALLDIVSGLPEIVKLAAYQHHERENGAGYPQGLRSRAICDVAKVVAVADAFAAATEPRAYRPRKRPYDALEDLVMLGSERMYWRPAVRALTKATGLFPVGSYVRLSSGEVARVLATHPRQIDRPRVSVVGPGGSLQERCEVDLRSFEPWELSVIQAVDGV